MIKCKSVAKLLTSDGLAGLSRWKRAEVRLHLMMCKYCSRLARQLEQLRIMCQNMPDLTEADPGLEDRIIGRISGSR
jgi:hypothetical protein